MSNAELNEHAVRGMHEQEPTHLPWHPPDPRAGAHRTPSLLGDAGRLYTLSAQGIKLYHLLGADVTTMHGSGVAATDLARV